MFKFWVASVIMISLICGLVFLSVQQVLRIGANDPQIQMAEDTAYSLARGQSIPTDFVTVDPSQSLAPFVITYDKKGDVTSSSAILNGRTPMLPPDALNSALIKGEQRFTWQPEPQVRIAAVVVPFSGKKSGFVLVGRSLREVEKREDSQLVYVLGAWIACVFVISFAYLFSLFSFDKKR